MHRDIFSHENHDPVNNMAYMCSDLHLAPIIQKLVNSIQNYCNWQ